jgi:hypothetical protein
VVIPERRGALRAASLAEWVIECESICYISYMPGVIQLPMSFSFYRGGTVDFDRVLSSLPLDPSGSYGPVTSVTETNGRLYFGSIGTAAMGWVPTL